MANNEPTYFLVILTLFWVSIESTVVDLPLGKVEGVIKKTVNGRSFHSFDGVPYAKPPVGKYRFREPLEPEPWQGIWKANTTYKCLQHNQVMPPVEDNIVGEEDCLYLNIYTPDTSPKKLYDVLFYIHGGGFMFTYCKQGPELLLDRDVVLVTLEYRLGPLGFLSTEDDVVPGNMGLKDQTAALKWIKQYIKYFGGNPDSVTIFGVSAGGASVDFHYLMPESRGLFHRGYSLSGNVLLPWVLSENAKEKARKLGAIVGCDFEDTTSMIECMKRRPGRQIVEAVSKFMVWLYNPFTPFGVVVDTWASKPVLSDHPYNLLKRKKIADAPWITSFTKTEGLFPGSCFYKDEYLKEMNDRWNELMPHIFDYNYTVKPELRDVVSEKIRKHYLDDKTLNKETFPQFLEALGDRLFVADIEKGSRLHAAAMESPSYAYVFNYRGAHSISEVNSGSSDNIGVSHADDLSYMIKTEMDTQTNEDDKKMTNIFLDMITSFAKTGKPQVPAEWQPLSKNPEDPYNLLSIESPVQFKHHSKSSVGNREFWDSLPMMENEKVFTTQKDEF